MTKTQKEIIEQGYQALINSLGVVDAIRFVQHLSPGHGDYTQERHKLLEEMGLDEILAAMREAEQKDDSDYDEIIGDEPREEEPSH